MTHLPVHKVPLTNVVTVAQLESIQTAGALIACDFYVQGAEAGEPIVGGYRIGRILNIDHHAPTREMQRHVSSTNLAADRIRRVGLETNAVVVISHTDCDSVLSAAMMAGYLGPEERFERAAIAADHTGEPNLVADLLQALDRREDSERDFWFCLRNLEALLEDQPLAPNAQALLNERLRKRAVAEDLVRGGHFHQLVNLYWAQLEEPIDSEYLLALIPDAWLIMIAAPHDRRPGSWVMKIRLGLSAPAGLSLHDLGIQHMDPFYGGRWNAGSNKRGGGTRTSPRDYARELVERVRLANE